MIKQSGTGIIIQARYASTRLPGKLFLPFYKSKRLIDVFLEGIIETVNSEYNIVLATSSNKKDNLFKDVAEHYGIDLFRGDENDVLKRTIDAANKYNFDTVIRVCADNPIYDTKGTLGLLLYHKKDKFDYTAYYLSGNLPSIRSHLGFWGEIAEVTSLEKVSEATSQQFYHEHVTNFLYSKPDKFNIQLIKAPKILFKRTDIRLTVDTADDYKMMQQLYSELKIIKSTFTGEEIVKYLDEHPDYLEKMKKQIARNKK